MMPSLSRSQKATCCCRAVRFDIVVLFLIDSMQYVEPVMDPACQSEQRSESASMWVREKEAEKEVDRFSEK